MRIIDRIAEYLKYRNLSAYTFEKACGIANGYLKKQTKGKGTVGSEIIEKILSTYRDISLTWLITGKGKMLVDNYSMDVLEPKSVSEPEAGYSSDQVIKMLREKIVILENALADKDKIISLLESKR